MTTETDLPPSSVAAFTEALKGARGSLDAWLEANDESEVAAHIEAYASACVSSATAEKDAEIDALRTRLEDTVRDSTNKIEALQADVERLNAESEQHLRQAMSNGAKARAAKAHAERLAEEMREARDRMLEQVKWVACDCGCGGDKPADAVSIAWLRASTLLHEQEEGK